MCVKGIPIVISAASGTGKTSLCNTLLETLPRITRSISYTTRPPRGSEVNGQDYFFVDDAEFDGMIERGAFVEWAHVFGRRYGTAYETIQALLSEGTDVLLNIDVQGGAQIRKQMPDSLCVFLLPPSMEELRRRLEHRATDDPSAISSRLATARDELAMAPLYDYWVVNDDYEQAADDLRTLVRAHRMRHNRPELLLQQLRSEISSI